MNERVSSGIPDLDKMLEGQGYYRGTSILVTGTAAAARLPSPRPSLMRLPPRRALPVY